MQEKTMFRRELRAERDVFFSFNPPSIAPHSTYLAQLTPDAIVAGYIAVGSEADPARLIDAARRAGCTIALPRVESKTAPLQFHRYDAGNPLLPGPFGLLQPSIDAPMVTPTILLIPLLGFTRAGDRLGQGAGHYDRALAANPDAVRIGVAWSVQERLTLPHDPWDMPLNAIITERDYSIAEPI